MRRFWDFCWEQGFTDYLRSSLSTAIEFLSSLFPCGHSYSSPNTARSALSEFLVMDNVDGDFGKHPVTVRFMKGIFQLKKLSTRYNNTWDVKCARDVIKNWG